MSQEISATGAQTIHPNNKKEVYETQVLDDATKTYVRFKRQRMVSARDTRDMPRDEYDGMGFLAYMDVLKKHDDQYIAPRKNKVDTSINVGTVRDKDTSLVEYAQKYSFEPIAQVFDDEDETYEELAETAEDMVRKSFMLEDAKTKAKLIARSMVAFGTAVVEDMWLEIWTMSKKFGSSKERMGSMDQTWTDKKEKTYAGCQMKLWDLKKCYWGDIRKFFMNGPQGQPFFFTAEYESYDVTKTIFEDWDNFKYVPNYVVYTPELNANNSWFQGWTLRPISTNYCEIIRYFDPIANEYGISINGVEMLPLMSKQITDEQGAPKTYISGFPLTAVSPSGAIPMAKFDLEPMHEFAISKAQPGKMRILADIENMWFKLILGMMKQKAKPTLGNKSGKQFGEEATEPANVINDIREGDLFPVLPNFVGATEPDFTFHGMLKSELSKNSVEDSFQGIKNQPGEETATENLNSMKSQSLKVAAMFDGLIYGYTQLFWLRTYNIIDNWTKPVDIQIDVEKMKINDVYRTVTVPATGENGGAITKKIIFTKNTPVRPKGKATLEDSQNIHQMEMDHKKEDGKDIALVHLNPEVLRSIKLNWFYTCVPVIAENDPLAYVMFAKQLTDATNMFGPDSLNVKKLKHEFAKMTGKDFDTWFLSQQDLDAKQQENQQNQQVDAQGNLIVNPAVAGQAPSIAGAVKGKGPQVGVSMK